MEASSQSNDPTQRDHDQEGAAVTKTDYVAAHGAQPGISSAQGKKRKRFGAAAPVREVPAKLDRYLILDELGAGGMGVVYAAYDPRLDRRVALKLMRPDRDDPFRTGGPQRLLREARAIAQISHPNIVTVYDIGLIGDEVYIAMELVEGRTLRTWLREEEPDWREIVRVYCEAGRGLAAAHAVGFIHRDFKPDNVLIGKDGRARVLDFGLAALVQGTGSGQADSRLPALGHEAALPELAVSPASVDGPPLPDPPVPSAEAKALALLAAREASSRLTRTGALVGTPAYMAPEQYASELIDARTDQYSFCIALYEGLYRCRPFGNSRPEAELFQRKLTEIIALPPAASPVPARIRRALLRGMRADPDQRWPAMEMLLSELTHDVRAAWLRRALVGLSMLAAIAIALNLWMWSSTGESHVCDDGASILGGVWDDADDALRGHALAKEALAAMEASGELDTKAQAIRAWLARRP